MIEERLTASGEGAPKYGAAVGLNRGWKSMTVILISLPKCKYIHVNFEKAAGTSMRKGKWGTDIVEDLLTTEIQPLRSYGPKGGL